MTKYLKMLALATSAAVLVACASSPDDSESEGTTTIKIGTWDFRTAGMENYYKAVIEEFESRHDNVIVESVDVPPGEYSTALTPELSAGAGPDVLMVFTQEYSVWAENGWLLDITDRFEQSDLPERVPSSLRDLADIDGMRYGILAEAAPQLLHVNTQLLTEAGVEGIPSSIEEFYDAAEAVKEKTGEWGYVPYLDPTEDMFMYRMAAQWALGFGSDFGEPGQINVNVPEVEEAMTWLAKLVEADIAPFGVSESDGRKLFYEGKAGMAIDGPWLAADASENNPELYPDVYVDTVPFPTGNSLTGGAFRGVNANTEHPDLAWELIEILFSPEMQELFVDQRLRPGGTTDSPDEAELLERAEWWPNMIDAVENHVVQIGYVPAGFESVEAQFRQKLAPYLVQILSGKLDVKDGLDQAQQELVDWAESQGLVE